MELAAPVFLDGNPAQKHERREEHAVSLIPANQVEQDGAGDGQRSEEEEGGQELHGSTASEALPAGVSGGG